MTLAEIVNPKTYGMDAATLAIMTALFGGTMVYFKNSLLSMARSVVSVFYVEVELSSINPSLRSVIAWMMQNHQYTILPIRRFGISRYGEDYKFVPGIGTVWYKVPKLPFISVTKKPEDKDSHAQTYRMFELSDSPVKIVFRFWFCGEKRAAKILENFSLADAAENARVYDYLASGSWWNRKAIAARTLETIHIPNEQKTRIVENVREFFSQESKDFYERASIPHRRGIMFRGVPGTGKTSLARAIRTAVNVPLYVLPLSGIDNDNQLMELISGVAKGSIILMEDVDAVGKPTASRSNKVELTPVDCVAPGLNTADEKPRGVTLAGLLNAIDGVHSPTDVIFIFSTNHPESLDDALLRDGRVDLNEEIGINNWVLHVEQIQQIFGKQIPVGIIEVLKNLPDMPASKIQGIALRNYVSNKEAAFNETLKELVSLAKENSLTTRSL